jgi:hypothetical protein
MEFSVDTQSKNSGSWRDLVSAHTTHSNTVMSHKHSIVPQILGAMVVCADVTPDPRGVASKTSIK